MSYSPEQEDTIDLLWTGGWDSTFSLLLLMDKDVVIQPYYIIDKQRPSYQKEIDTMNIIRTAVVNKYPGKINSLLPTIYVDLDDIDFDEDICRKYKNLQQKTGLGAQYCWLASYAKQKCLSGLHLSAQKHILDEDSRIISLLANNLERVDDGVTGPYWKPSGIPDETDISIFSYFRFPLIDYTKLDMLETAKKEGFQDVLRLTWFCHTPIKGNPCGVCTPCKIVIAEGLSERLPPEAIRRYKYRMLYNTYSKIKGKIKNIMVL